MSSKGSAPSISPCPTSRQHISNMLLSLFYTRATLREDSQGEFDNDLITTHWSLPYSADNSQPLSPPFNIWPFSEDDNSF
jgi:hypothetical protein